MKPFVHIALIALTLLVFRALVFQLFSFNSYVKSQDRTATATAQATTDALKTDISALLEIIKTAGNELGESFGDKDYTDEDIRVLLREVSLKYPAIRGVTACYEPFGFSDSKRLYCPYYNKGNQSYLYVEDSYDYTIKGSGTAWYTSVVENGATWVDPYYGTAAQEWYVDYGVPFYYMSGPKRGQVRGIIDFSLEVGDFKNLLHSLSVGRAGYGIITSNNETFISHPVADYVGKKKIRDVLNDDTPEGLRRAYAHLQSGERGQIEFFDETNNEDTIFVHDTIEASGYGIGMAFTGGLSEPT